MRATLNTGLAAIVGARTIVGAELDPWQVTDAPLEPLNTESTSSMLERAKRRFWHTSGVDLLVEDVERR